MPSILKLRGSPALSAFRLEKLKTRLAGVGFSRCGAEFWHFVETSRPLTAEEQVVLAKLLEYGPAVDSNTDLPLQAKVGPDKVVVVEKWEDIAALKAHSAAPHMQAYRVNVKDYVLGVHLLVLDPAE